MEKVTIKTACPFTFSRSAVPTLCQVWSLDKTGPYLSSIIFPILFPFPCINPSWFNCIWPMLKGTNLICFLQKTEGEEEKKKKPKPVLSLVSDTINNDFFSHSISIYQGTSILLYYWLFKRDGRPVERKHPWILAGPGGAKYDCTWLKYCSAFH